MGAGGSHTRKFSKSQWTLVSAGSHMLLCAHSLALKRREHVFLLPCALSPLKLEGLLSDVIYIAFLIFKKGGKSATRFG